MKKLLITGILLLYSIQAFAIECTGTVTGIDSESAACNGYTSYQNSANPAYWICSDSVKSDDLLMLAYSMETPVKTEIDGAGGCNSITQHYLVGNALSIAYSEFAITSYEVEYLVVGGGGGGGGGTTDYTYWGTTGGGGAGGGVRTGTKTLEPGVTYIVTIGPGGVAGPYSNGYSGGNSSFDDIIAAGGGYGGYGGYPGSPGANGGAGGSGGGGGSGDCYYYYIAPGSGGVGDTPDVTPDQGTNGGGGLCSVRGGHGGGSGISWEGQGTFGVGGNGGTWSTGKTAGAANTGDGGDGGAIHPYGDSAPRSGGSGVVILRIPVGEYSGNVTGSPTVTEIGLYKYIKFTSNGSYTG